MRSVSAVRNFLIRAACVAMVCRIASAADSLPQVPEGFTIERVAASPLVKHPMMAGFDDRGRLFVAESAGKNLRAADLLKAPPNFIRMLEDADGDGTFDKSTIFADKMTLPMGALWYRGALYVASPPNIWRLEDTDDDGVADRRDVLVDTFGFTGNAASIHGCFLGPNGRIYWCDGRHGHEFRDSEGRVVSKGKAARIFSCRPDGSDVQIFCGGGMDNPVEVDFSPEGEMFGTVNILLSRPRVDCLMHWMDGGVYPREDQQDCIAEFRRTGGLLPPMTQLGHVAVSGMTRYRSEHFGPEYRDNIFTTIFNTHKVLRSIVERTGATFQTREEDFLVSDDPDFHPTDVLEDADGSLLVIDTGGWFRIGCPTSQIAKPEIHGAIYRIRRTGAPALEDPRGIALNLESRAPKELAALLNDPRPAVREQAIDRLALAGAEAVPVLQPIIAERSVQTGDAVMKRRNAVWALSRMDDRCACGAIVEALGDPSESVRLAAARSLGTLRDPSAVDALCALVTSDTPAVRREAATSLGRIVEAGKSTADAATRRQVLDAIFTAAVNSSADRVLEHALIYAAIRIADREQTVTFLNHASPQVRRAALIALDQMDGGRLTRELVTPLLDTDDPQLQQQALAVISSHAGWASETLDLLRQWFDERQLTDERSSVLRGFLLAQAADAEIQKLVAESLARPQLPTATRLLLLEVIHRASLEPLPSSWLQALEASLRHADPAVRLQAVQIVQARGLVHFDAQLQELARDGRQPLDIRTEALAAVASRLKSLDGALFGFLLNQLSETAPPLLRLATARALADARLSGRQLIRLAASFDRAGPLAVPIVLRAFHQSSDAEVGRALVAALNQSASSTSVSPDELGALLRNYPSPVQENAAALLKRLGVDLAAQQARLAALAPLAAGGDADRGRAVFFGKKAACASCHTVGNEGGKVGPDLTKIGAIRTGRDLLEAVVLPSASFARGYRPYVIVTDEGRIHTGIISRQTADTVYLRTAELAEVRIPRESIEEMKESSTSIMPKGLETTLSEEELRDLLAYLQQRR